MCHKAAADDFPGRFREIVSDPLNLLIRRVPDAGLVEGGHVVLHNGLRVPFGDTTAYYGEFSSILVINRGVHEPLEEFVFQEVLQRLAPTPVMLELGSYWGHYSMWLKFEKPSGIVFMVEPERMNLDVGRKNFLRNDLEGTFIEDFVSQNRFTVDAFLASRKLQKLDVLHSDIQGFELEMLDGASDALEKKRVDYVFVSTHSQPLHVAVLQRLRTHDYRIDISADFTDHTTAFDGFVLASSPSIPPLFQGFSPRGRLDILRSTPKQLVEYVAETMRISSLDR